MKKIVIVGAGYAGILTAKKLAKRLKKHPDTEITIIDRNPFHTMLTELHEVAAGRVDEDSIKINLNKVFAGRKVHVKLDTVESIDYGKKVVSGKSAQYEYDYLVLAAGSKPTFFGVEGASENSFKLWSYEDAVLLKEHIHSCFRKAATETNLEEKKRLLTFYVVGAGFTGVEMAGELAEYVPVLCREYYIDPEYVKIFNVDVLSRVIPILPEKLSAKAEARLRKMGVEVLLKQSVCAIGKDFISIKEGETCVKHSCETVIWTAGIESADVTSQAAEQFASAGRGRIKTDSYLRTLENDSVYIAGDNMFYIPEGEKDPVPQMVENCEHCADTIAHNIVCAVTGAGKMEEYKPSFHGVMVCIGGRYGVARVGLPNLMFNLPSFLAMLSKHFINVIYFIQVLGWNKVFNYLRHEFFTIRNNRSFVGGHLSNKTPSFLLMPVRVWLGAVWVFEAIKKITEGWFGSAKLSGFFGGANAWFQQILTGVGGATSGATAADATSAATGAAAGEAVAAGVKIFDINFLGIFHAIFVSGKEIAQSTLMDFAFKLDVPLMNWFIDKLIIPSDAVQIFMQGFIVIAELLVGLALIGGLFTTPAAGFSLILHFMFVCTTGLYLGNLWMFFAAIAVLIGGGRTLGLDYYFMPKLKELWRKLPIVRKLYIYND